MIRQPPRSTQSRSSSASDVYKGQECGGRRGQVCGGGASVVNHAGDLQLGDTAAGEGDARAGEEDDRGDDIGQSLEVVARGDTDGSERPKRKRPPRDGLSRERPTVGLGDVRLLRNRFRKRPAPARLAES